MDGGDGFLSQEEYQINIPVYEGPMDLLLHLVTKNRIDIHDIPIHEITDQRRSFLIWIWEVVFLRWQLLCF